MKNKWVLVAAGVAVVGLIGAAALLDSRPASKSPAGASAAGTSTVTAGSADSSSGAGGPNESPAGATTKTDASSSAKGKSSSGAGSASRDSSSTPPTPQRTPVPLKRVTTPPTHTTAFLDAKRYTVNSKYKVKFVPYGTGPSPSSLVIQVSTSEAVGKVAKPAQFAGRNLLVTVAKPGASLSVDKGGEYTGTVELLPQGDLLAPTLTSAVRAK